MMRTKDIVRIAMCVAMLIGGQLALSAVSGIEVVTVLLLCFCFSYGIKNGVAAAITFSLLRCLIFGFYINVVILYLVYYTLFALFFGWLGSRLGNTLSFPRILLVIACAVIFTLIFTLLDNVITPLVFGFNQNAARVYFTASLATLIPQLACTAVTVSVFFVPITKIISKLK